MDEQSRKDLLAEVESSALYAYREMKPWPDSGAALLHGRIPRQTQATGHPPGPGTPNGIRPEGFEDHCRCRWRRRARWGGSRCSGRCGVQRHL